MTFQEFFDPRNLTHMEAYVHVAEKGCWPVGFIPDDLDMANWHLFAMSAFADMAIEDYKQKVREQRG